jgi:hypothetical protein
MPRPGHETGRAEAQRLTGKLRILKWMTLEERLDRLEKSQNNLNGLVSDLREAMIVTAAVQKRQAEVQKSQAEHLDRLDQSIEKLSLAVYEVTDKLNGLIGFLDRGRT